MNRIKHIIKKEFRQIRRDRSMIGITLIMPVIQLIILGYVISAEVRNITAVICDLDRSQHSFQIVRKMKASGYFKLKYYETEEQKIAEYLNSGKAQVAVIIPNDLSQNMLKQQKTDIQVLLDGQDSNSANITLGYIAGILQDYQKELLDIKQKSFVKSGDMKRVVPKIRIWYNPELVYSDFMIPGIAAFLLTMITSLLSAMGLVREREIGTLEQLLVTPIKKYELLIGKIVPFAILGIIELVIAIVFAKLWYDIPIVGNLFLFALFAVIYIFTCLGLGLFVSSIAHTQQQALFMTWFAMIFIFLMSGFVFPIENMPKFAQILSYVNPLRYFMVIIREIFIKGAELHHLYSQGIALLIFSGTIFGFAVQKFQNRIK